jgi:prepilin-type N-terminal cleavage/methylation domain-containing protein
MSHALGTSTSGTSSLSRRGFTLVELMIGLVIVAVLMGMVLTGMTNATTPAATASLQSDIGRLQSAMNDVFNETGQYAATVAWATTTGAPLNLMASTGNQVAVTTDVGGLGALIQARNPSLTLSCSMNLGTHANPGVLTCP